MVPILLRMRKVKDAAIQEQAQEALSLVGYSDPLPCRGMRILSLDGGGTRYQKLFIIMLCTSTNVHVCNPLSIPLFVYKFSSSLLLMTVLSVLYI